MPGYTTILYFSVNTEEIHHQQIVNVNSVLHVSLHTLHFYIQVTWLLAYNPLLNGAHNISSDDKIVQCTIILHL